MNIKGTVFLTLTLLYLSFRISEQQELNEIAKKSIKNIYPYNPFGKLCPFQDKCPSSRYFAAADFNRYLPTILKAQVQEFTDLIFSKFGLKPDRKKFTFNISAYGNNLGKPATSNCLELQNYIIRQTYAFDSIGSYFEYLLLNAETVEAIEMVRVFATCPIGEFLEQYQKNTVQDYSVEGNSGSGAGFGAQLYLYDKNNAQGNKFTKFASIGGGSGGGISQINNVVTSWGAGGGGGLSITLPGQSQSVQLGGGLGFGYDSNECPLAQQDTGTNTEIFFSTFIQMKSLLLELLVGNEIEIFMAGGGGGGGGIGASQNAYFYFGFEFHYGSQEAYNDYLNLVESSSSNSAQSLFGNRLSIQFINCTTKSQNYDWLQLTACVCSGFSAADQDEYLSYMNCSAAKNNNNNPNNDNDCDSALDERVAYCNNNVNTTIQNYYSLFYQCIYQGPQVSQACAINYCLGAGSLHYFGVNCSNFNYTDNCQHCAF